MLVVAAIAVGFLGVGAFALTRRAPLPPAPPPPGAHTGGVVGGSAGDTPAGPAPTHQGPPKEVKDALAVAKEGAELLGGGEDAVKAASKIVTQVLDITVKAEARTAEGKTAAGVGTAVAGAVGAFAAYEVFLASSAWAGPVGLAVAVAAIVVVAFVTNIVDAAVELDHERQRPFIQQNIDVLVSIGNLTDAWALAQEARNRGIAVGFLVSVPTWGDERARHCVPSSLFDFPFPGGAQFLDGEKLIQSAYAAAHEALQADLKLPWTHNAAGQLVRPRTNRDAPAAVQSRKNGDAWCGFIGGHTLQAVDAQGVTHNDWVGLTPWQPAEMLQRNYAPHDPPDAKQTSAANTKNSTPATAAGRVRASTPTAAAGLGAPAATGSAAAGGNAATNSHSTASSGATQQSTGGGKPSAGDSNTKY